MSSYNLLPWKLLSGEQRDAMKGCQEKLSILRMSFINLPARTGTTQFLYHLLCGFREEDLKTDL